MADRIPIAAAERIGKAHLYDQVVIYARRVGDDGIEWVTTWGRNKAHCDAAARIGDAIGRQVVRPIEERDEEIARLKAQLSGLVAVPRKLLHEAHAVMRECGWQLAVGNATSGDGIIEAAAAEIEARFGALLEQEEARRD
jgi:hypothetical protein